MARPTVDLYATYSIVARDPTSRQLGAAVQTHQMTVGNFVPWMEAGVGALATQALGNIRFGPMGLALLRQGIPAERVVAALIATDDDAKHRQLAVVDAQGQVAAWTGEGCIAYADHYTGEGYSVQANMMAEDTVVEAMAAAYEAAEGDLAERMMSALHAAQLQGAISAACNPQLSRSCVACRSNTRSRRNGDLSTICEWMNPVIRWASLTGWYGCAGPSSSIKPVTTHWSRMIWKVH
jgi:hypothetical protein